MKLHLGCGVDWRAGYLNVDCSPFAELAEWARREGRLMVLLPGEEFLQHDLREPWPWTDASAEEIVCNQTLEHFADAELPGVLAEARRVIQPGAVFSGTVPDFRAVYEATVLLGQGSGWPLGDTGPYPAPWMNALQNLAHGGGHHKQVFVTEKLLERLRLAGFAAIVREVSGWNLHFEARRATP
jgi:SAM-dependent methyltransferase